jgi:hypothetical protein
VQFRYCPSWIYNTALQDDVDQGVAREVLQGSEHAKKAGLRPLMTASGEDLNLMSYTVPIEVRGTTAARVASSQPLACQGCFKGRRASKLQAVTPECVELLRERRCLCAIPRPVP